MSETGTRTEDLRLARPPELPADEARTQRFGRRAFTGGLTICILLVVGTLVAWILADTALATSRDGALFGILLFAGGLTIGASLTVLGGMERQHRPVRARQRHAEVELRRVQTRIESLIQDTNECFEVVMGLLGPINGRLSEFADRVDSGGVAYLERLDRVEAATTAVAEQLTLIAQHLPDAMLSEHWRGFNEAVREGFAAQQTGTDGGSRRRPGHLGLAPGPNER